MLDFIWAFNRAIFIFFTVFYSFQAVYTITAVVAKITKRTKKTTPENVANHRYAVMIAARNEALVIAELIRSVKEQNYPSELIDIYVIADSCTDHTADIAKREGANVIKRNDPSLPGKGHALDHAFGILKQEGKIDLYDGFFVFDADNILDPDFIASMNKLYDQGYCAITGYRNSKNFGDNWITSSYSLWFLREAVFLNMPRMILNTSCAISGTGFMVRSEIIRRNDGWKCFLLTEDIEFNAKRILEGETISYCEDAIFYDEQPRKFKQSWNQRMRWIKGTYQVVGKYGAKLFASMFRSKPLAKYDLLMSIAPALIVTFAGVAVNLTCLILSSFELTTDIGVAEWTIRSLLSCLASFYLVFLGLAGLTLVTEWKKIHAKPWQKILSAFTFPFFIFTYIPISIIALFKKVRWTPIQHTVVKGTRDLS